LIGKVKSGERRKQKGYPSNNSLFEIIFFLLNIRWLYNRCKTQRVSADNSYYFIPSLLDLFGVGIFIFMKEAFIFEARQGCS